MLSLMDFVLTLVNSEFMGVSMGSRLGIIEPQAWVVTEYKPGGMLGIFGLFLEGHFSKNMLDVLVT